MRSGLSLRMLFVNIFLLLSCGYAFKYFTLPKIAVSRYYLQAVGTVEGTQENAAKEYSFVQDDLRTYAMKLHTRDQSPKEGQQQPQTPFTQWEPQRADYLKFLVDSLVVYETLEEIVHKYPILAPFKSTGLERSQALKEDLVWMCEYDKELKVPSCGDRGIAYSIFLRQLASESIPKFICHYYNHYFAHTAGGRMIGKKMSEKLLENKLLKFYQWEGDVKELLEKVRTNIDILANTWSDEEKKACLEETMACFKYGGGLVSYLKSPLT